MAVEALSPYRPLMNFRRIPYYARVVVSGHLCNWLWRSRLERRRARGRAIRKAADAYLQAHSAEKFSLEEMACALYVNGSYLLRTFRRNTGITPLTYHHQLRCARAKTWPLAIPWRALARR